jgi:hypothetical protein
MDRRNTIKSVLLGSLSGGLLLSGCTPEEKEKAKALRPGMISGPYGRTDKEKARDEKITGETFFTEHELTTIAVLCDLILPATPTAPSATGAEVPEFIDFIVKDIPRHQLPLRGGLMWLDHHAVSNHERIFIDCTVDQQKKMLDEIAYPENSTPSLQPGIQFFNRMRDLVLTGYYTTKAGIDDLGYKGNTPNVWDGVPQEVLDKHGMSYDKDWLAKCVDQEKRDVIAEWDGDGNLLT